MEGSECSKLTLKDYIAFLIALVTTHLLPLIVISAIVLIITIMLSLIFG
ncbi:MAG: hypothetical protein NZ992_03825 [Candidatus Korarchaeum sp.]|nr:hypothetical protein [Candidatus Korarchaeum sp.]MDW8035103.1 hypothetical protein [Candidatus Korarchaeum sp.]